MGNQESQLREIRKEEVFRNYLDYSRKYHDGTVNPSEYIDRYRYWRDEVYAVLAIDTAEWQKIAQSKNS